MFVILQFLNVYWTYFVALAFQRVLFPDDPLKSKRDPRYDTSDSDDHEVPPASVYNKGESTSESACRPSFTSRTNRPAS